MIPVTYVAIDPRTGLHLRAATDAERDAYLAQPCRCAAFRRPIKVGDVLVDEDTGPGISHAGAGF